MIENPMMHNMYHQLKYNVIFNLFNLIALKTLFCYCKSYFHIYLWMYLRFITIKQAISFTAIIKLRQLMHFGMCMVCT